LDFERLEARSILAVNLGTNFSGLNFPDSFDSVPPDTIAAAGPGHIVEVVNAAIGIFDKATGARLFHQSLDEFFDRFGPFTGLFDPVVAYDEMAERFIVGVLELDEAGQESFFEFAVSDTSDPLDGFREMHQIDVTNSFDGGPLSWADFPRVGWNADAYVFSFNMFAFGGDEPFDHVQVLSIDKSTVLDDPLLDLFPIEFFQSARDDTHFTLAPATMHDSRLGGPMWFVESGSETFGSTVRVVKMTDVLSSTPTFSDQVITVSPYSEPPSATQRRGKKIETQDSRILNAAWRDDRLVASQTVGEKRAARARWYEFDTSGDMPVLTQSGTIFQGKRVHTYYPSIEIAANGDLGMTFMQSSSKQFMSMYVTGRTTADPLGFMQMPVLVRAGAARYSAFDRPPYRAGDFSGITVDPVGETSFWAANEFATAAPTNNWGTWITQFTVTPAMNAAAAVFVLESAAEVYGRAPTWAARRAWRAAFSQR
jgi:hypothetical protein